MKDIEQLLRFKEEEIKAIPIKQNPNMFNVPSKKKPGHEYIFQRHYNPKRNFRCYDCLTLKRILKTNKDPRHEKFISIPMITIDEDEDNTVIGEDFDEGHFCLFFGTEGYPDKPIYRHNFRDIDFGPIKFSEEYPDYIETTSRECPNDKFFWREREKGRWDCLGCAKLKRSLPKDDKRKIAYIKVRDGRIVIFDPERPKNDHICKNHTNVNEKKFNDLQLFDFVNCAIHQNLPIYDCVNSSTQEDKEGDDIVNRSLTSQYSSDYLLSIISNKVDDSDANSESSDDDSNDESKY